MTDKELDKLFQQSFSAHEMPVPKGMWQRVNPQQKKKRRVAFWWQLGIGVAALLFAGAIAWFALAPLPAKRATQKTAAASKINPVQLSGNNNAPSSSGNNQKSTTASSPGDFIIPPNAAANSSSQKLKEGIVGKLNRQNEKLQQHQTMNSGKAVAPEIMQPAEKNVPENKENIAGKTDSLQENEAAIKTASATSVTHNDSAALAATNHAAKADSAASAAAVSTVQIHAPLRHKTSIEWMAAGFTGNRTVYNVKKQEPAFFVSRNKPDVKAEVQSFSLTMRVEKNIGLHWQVKTGLQFLQTHQRIAYNTETVNQYAVVNALSVMADTTRFTQLSVHRPEIKSIYNSVALPLLIGYHTNGKQWSIGASGGVILNLFSWYKGEVPDGDYRKKIKAANVFRRNSGSSLYLSLPVAKRLGSWQLFAEPQFQYSLSSLTKSGASFRQRMMYYGAGFGLKKDIGK